MAEESRNTDRYSQRANLDSGSSFRNPVQHDFMGIPDGVAAEFIYLARSE
jgi:hypothetical protein